MKLVSSMEMAFQQKLHAQGNHVTTYTCHCSFDPQTLQKDSARTPIDNRLLFKKWSNQPGDQF